jgi:Holliday junction resolvase
MGKINSRAKGAAGEREFIKELALELGDELVAPLKRNLEQTRAGGHDIVGLEGFAIEIKRYKQIKEGDIVKFWEQAKEQAQRIDAEPVLAYREDMRSWRVVVSCNLLNKGYMTGDWSVEWTATISLKAFSYLVREQHSATQLHKAESPATLAA